MQYVVSIVSEEGPYALRIYLQLIYVYTKWYHMRCPSNDMQTATHQVVMSDYIG